LRLKSSTASRERDHIAVRVLARRRRTAALDLVAVGTHTDWTTGNVVLVNSRQMFGTPEAAGG
jgi:hypothetical protein